MRELIVRQINLTDYKHVKLHKFPFPEIRDKGFYRTITSYSAFFESVKRRNKSKRYLFSVVDHPDFQSDFEKERNAMLPIQNHENLYDFFTNIGYDRTTKKWIEK